MILLGLERDWDEDKDEEDEGDIANISVLSLVLVFIEREGGRGGMMVYFVEYLCICIVCLV